MNKTRFFPKIRINLGEKERAFEAEIVDEISECFKRVSIRNFEEVIEEGEKEAGEELGNRREE